ncbi:MAG TPA: hypothetical protein ENN75_00850 [candidate division Zixibacteria bacterium]|nr:hypothetical protein [candidate division Zixibacteria bacterium]
MNSKLKLFTIVLMIFITTLSAQIQPARGKTENFQIVVDIITVLFLLLGVYLALELNRMMKGGELAMSWGWLSGAVIVFALIKVIEVGGMAEFWVVPQLLISFGHLFTGLFLLLGYFRQKRILG